MVLTLLPAATSINNGARFKQHGRARLHAPRRPADRPSSQDAGVFLENRPGLNTVFLLPLGIEARFAQMVAKLVLLCGSSQSDIPRWVARQNLAYRFFGRSGLDFCALQVPSSGVLEPWAYGIRRFRLGDHVVVFGEHHLRHLLSCCQRYYNELRPHLALKKDAPIPRDVQGSGSVLSLPILGGLHHRHVRV
jgi:hypothetical protein